MNPNAQSDTPTGKAAPRRSADFESLTVDAEMQGCFSGEALGLAITIEGISSSVMLKHGVGAGASSKQVGTVDMAMERARQLINEFLKTLATPQRLAGDQSTTVYVVDVEWIKGGSKSKWTYRSSELPIEVAQGIMPQLGEEKRAAIQHRLNGYFNAAHEVFKLCQRVVREHESAAP